MDEKDFKKITITLAVIILLVLAFLVVRPILMAIILGIILAYLFKPLYKKLKKKIKSENLSAFIILLGVLVTVLLPLVLLIPVIARQILNIYLSMQQVDLALVLKDVSPALFQSLSTSADFIAMTSSLTSNIASFFLNSFKDLIFNIPSILLQTIIVLFTFFFMMRDHEEMKEYIKSLSPFSKEVQGRFYSKFEQVTSSILYGQLVVGIAQGIIAGFGYLIFGVPNTLLLTIITMLVGVIPVIGPWLIWIPIDIYLFLSGDTTQGIGLLIYGLLIINWIDSLIRPLVVSRMTKMNSAIALIGMVGGLYMFGILGLILGPLILAYLLLLAEFYKQKKFKSILLEEQKPMKKFPLP